MNPADALDRIVYLLDRVLAEGQKVKAFARARDVVLATDDGELVRLHRLGKLTDLAGIGPTTGKVIAEALDGGIPASWPSWRRRPCSRWARGRPCGRRCGATATPIRPGRTAGPRSTRWPGPRSRSATTTWC